MALKIAIHQPNFIPWIGWWHKYVCCGEFVILDKAQFSKGDYHNRTTMGVLMLTVPVRNAPVGTRIDEMTISDLKPLRKIGRTIEQLVAKTPHKSRLGPVLDLCATWQGEKLLDLNMAMIQTIRKTLGLPDKFSLHGRPLVGSAPANLSDIVKGRGGSMYLAGGGALNYSTRSEYAVPDVMLQRMQAPKWHSILEVLAHSNDPVSDIAVAGGWQPWRLAA